MINKIWGFFIIIGVTVSILTGKIELINDLPEDEIISFYKQGEFVDLCRGPHLPSTGKVKAIKLTSMSSAYWRGDAKNQSLQRIYGIIVKRIA